MRASLCRGWAAGVYAFWGWRGSPSIPLPVAPPPCTCRGGSGSTLDEALQRRVRFVVGGLDRRVLAEIGRRRVNWAGQAAVLGDLRAADHVDRDAGRVRAVLDRQAKLDVHRHAAEQLALHAQEADLVVVLPSDVIGRADVDVLI